MSSSRDKAVPLWYGLGCRSLNNSGLNKAGVYPHLDADSERLPVGPAEENFDTGAEPGTLRREPCAARPGYEGSPASEPVGAAI